MIIAAADSVDVALLNGEFVKRGFWNSLVRKSKVLHSGSVNFQLDDNLKDESKRQLNRYLANTVPWMWKPGDYIANINSW